MSDSSRLQELRRENIERLVRNYGRLRRMLVSLFVWFVLLWFVPFYCGAIARLTRPGIYYQAPVRFDTSATDVASASVLVPPQLDNITLLQVVLPFWGAYLIWKRLVQNARNRYSLMSDDELLTCLTMEAIAESGLLAKITDRLGFR